MQTTTLIHPEEQKHFTAIYWLSVFTIVYNFVEGLVATIMGFEDETLTLFGFGVDSFIELISGAGILYMISRIQRQPNSPRSTFEVQALLITGWAFYALSAGLLVSVALSLYTHQRPQTTFWGVVVSVVSIAVMWWLLQSKVRIGNALQSKPILADAACTRTCIYMSVVLLAASAIYELTGFAYADAIGSLGIIYFSVIEGKECFDKAKGITTCCGHCH